MVSAEIPGDGSRLPSLSYLDARDAGPVSGCRNGACLSTLVWQVCDEAVEELVWERGGSLVVANYFGEFVTKDSVAAKRRGVVPRPYDHVGPEDKKYHHIITKGHNTTGTCCMTWA